MPVQVDRVDRVDRAKMSRLSVYILWCSKSIGEVDRVLQKTTLLGPTCVRVHVCVHVHVYSSVNY